MKIRILESALHDLDHGRRFYESQGVGLGTYFLDSMFSEIDSLVLYAGIHRKVFGCHRIIAKRFPYAIYYKVENKEIVTVWRVLDLRRLPSKIKADLR